MTTWNFNAGPSMFIPDVMKTVQNEFLNYDNLGMSVVEMSHRSAEYMSLADKARETLKRIMNIPDNYTILFAQGGGRGQFAAIPLNLLQKGQKAYYFVTGHWSRSAYKECAQKYGDAVLVECVDKDADGRFFIDYEKMSVSDAKNVAYAYICLNETVNGIEMFDIPDFANIPLIADLSSNILTRPIDVSKFGAIIFGAQKNVAPAGLTICIVRNDLIGHALDICPSILDWKILADNDSMYNTPNTFSWYFASLVFKWIEDFGGTSKLEELNIAKSDLLYNYIDNSSFYYAPIAKNSRSRVNCVFNLKDESLNTKFLEEAKKNNLIGLKGHKVLGGMRASLYNAMPIEGVKALVEFLDFFAKKNQ